MGWGGGWHMVAFGCQPYGAVCQSGSPWREPTGVTAPHARMLRVPRGLAPACLPACTPHLLTRCALCPLPPLPCVQPLVDVEAEVATAVDAVAKAPVKEVSDADILSYMLDKGVITKDAVIQALAVHSLGERAYSHERAAPEADQS